MKKTIINVLKQIELNENIEILYACEAGSRVWGFSRKDSDYDVRFIYKKAKSSDYLSLKNERDVIEYEADNLDIVGWDIRKALAMHYKNNPQLREWLLSDITYIDKDICDIFKGLGDFDRNMLMNHYSSIAYSHWRRYSTLEFNRNKTKKYLHIIRSILCWNLLNLDIYPPVKIQDLLENDSVKISCQTKCDIIDLIEYHRQLKDEISEDTMFRIHNFILKSLKVMKKVNVNSVKEIEDYDERLREVLNIAENGNAVDESDFSSKFP